MPGGVRKEGIPPIPEGYDWNGCKTCAHYKEYLRRGYLLSFDFDHPISKTRDKLADNELWVKNIHGGIFQMTRKYFEEVHYKKPELFFEEVKITSCRLRWVGEKEFEDIGKISKKEYCAYWKPILTVKEAYTLRNKRDKPAKGHGAIQKRKTMMEQWKKEEAEKEKGETLTDLEKI